MNVDKITSFPHHNVPLLVMIVQTAGLSMGFVIGFTLHPDAMGETECGAAVSILYVHALIGTACATDSTVVFFVRMLRSALGI